MPETESVPIVERATTLEYRVPFADTDKMGIVYYANYFVFFERLRNELFRLTGKSYRYVEDELGLAMPVVEAHAEYEDAARYDDLLVVGGRLTWVKGSRFRVDYEIRRDGGLLVTGYTVHTTMNLEGNPRRVPELIYK